MSREIRRLHRKNAEFTNFTSNKSVKSSNVTETAFDSIKDDADSTIENQFQAISYSPSASINDINSIRAEFREDNYHSQLSESDFFSDTHDWGGDNEELSADYWHFVGSYE